MLEVELVDNHLAHIINHSVQSDKFQNPGVVKNRSAASLEKTLDPEN